jgi:hypothetical protein
LLLGFALEFSKLTVYMACCFESRYRCLGWHDSWRQALGQWLRRGRQTPRVGTPGGNGDGRERGRRVYKSDEKGDGAENKWIIMSWQKGRHHAASFAATGAPGRFLALVQ